MAQDKKLIIGTQFDDKGLQNAEKALKRLQKEGLKIGNILKDLDLSTGAGRGRFAKSIIQTEKQMGKLKGTTQDTAKVMQNVYGRQLEMESKRLDRVSKQLERLNKLRKEQQVTYETAMKSGSAEAQRSARMRMNNTEDRIVTTEGSRRVRQENLEELRGKSQKYTAEDKLLIGKAIADAVGGMAGQFQSMKNLGWGNMATTASFQGNMMRQMLGGNFALSDALTHGRRDFAGNLVKGRELFDSASGKGAAKLENFANGASSVLSTAVGALGLAGGGAGAAGSATNVAKGVAVGNSISGIGGGVQGMIAAGANPIMGGPEATEAGTLNERAGLAVKVDPVRELVYEQLAANARTRLSGSRRLGSRHMGMAGMGAGYGLDMAESIGSASGMAEQFGARNVTGGLFHHALRAETFGIDRMKAGSMIGGLGQAVGGSDKAAKQLEEIFARGVKRGLSPENVQYFEAIGQAVASHAFGTGGGIGSGTALGSALSYGLDGNSSMHDVGRNIGGMAALDNLGQNGYFRAINLENAKKSLGGGADWASVQSLGDASWADLMGGNEEMDALGIGKDARQGAMQNRMDSMLNTAVGGKSSMGRGLLAARDKAGGWQAALKDPKLRRQAAALLHQTLKGSAGGFQSFDDAMGALNFSEGAFDDTGGGGGLRKQGDSNAFAQLSTQANIQMQLQGKEKGIVSKDVFANAQNFFEKLTEVKPGLEAATDALKALEGVYDVLKKIAEVGDKAARKIDEKSYRAGTGKR